VTIAGSVAGKIKEAHINDLARKFMYRYGVAVNEDRSLPDFRDGLKPVHRRTLWAAYGIGATSKRSVVKSARIVGETIGKYHPHGDSAAYGALVTMVGLSQQLLEGEGNFGTLSEPKAAAMRYTNARISRYADLVLFDPFYMAVTKMVPNYDAKDVEPLVIPSLLPNLLLNGTSGIGVGTTSEVPRFTLPSIIELVTDILTGQEATPQLCFQKLKFTCEYGGTAISNKETMPEIKRFFKTGIGSITFKSMYRIEPDKKRFVFYEYAPIGNLKKKLEALNNLDFVESATDESEPDDRFGLSAVYFKRSVPVRDYEALAKKTADKFMRSKCQFRMNVTERFINSKGEAEAKFRPTTVSQLILDWISWREQLEIEACSHHIAISQKEIRKLELMLLAVQFRELIIKALSQKFNDQQLAEYLAKNMKIAVEEAKFILDLRIRQLKALEANMLSAKKEEQEKYVAELEGRKKHPKKFIVKQLEHLSKELSKT
jgi:DNA gyrase/topoisomerase IV subunit A